MPWLADPFKWAYRIELTVDHTKLDESLTHFPVSLSLYPASGQSGQDTTAVFDELGTDYKKIAVTKDDGVTQLYVEVERWDVSNELAKIWVSRSNLTLSSTADTTLYLYFDSSKANNTTYVGDVQDSPALNVWDSYFVAVWNFAQDASVCSGYCVLDSTGNYDAWPVSGATSRANDGNTGYALELDASSSEYLYIGNISEIQGVTEMTVSAVVRFPNVDTQYTIFAQGDDFDNYVVLRRWSDGWYSFIAQNANVGYTAAGLGAVNSWQHVAGFVYDNGSFNACYVEGVGTEMDDGPGTTPTVSDPATIGTNSFYDASPAYFTGKVSTVRLSSIARSPAWLRAEKENANDNLLTYSAAQSPTNTLSSSLPAMTASGIINNHVVDASLPVLTALSTTGISTNLTLPALSASGGAGGSADVSLPSITGGGVIPMYLDLVGASFPALTLSATGNTFKVEASLPSFTFNIETGASAIPSLPALSCSARLYSDYVSCELKRFSSLYPGELPSLTATIRTGASTGSISLPDNWTSTSDCDVGDVASLSESLPSLSASGTCKVGRTATLAKALPSISVDAKTGARFGKDFPSLAASGTCKVGVPATFSKRLPGLSLSATGTTGIVGALSSELPMLTISTDVDVEKIGTLSKTLPSFVFVGRASEHTRFGDYTLSFSDW